MIGRRISLDALDVSLVKRARAAVEKVDTRTPLTSDDRQAIAYAETLSFYGLPSREYQSRALGRAS